MIVSVPIQRSFFNYAGEEGLRRRWNAILDQLLPKEIASKLRTSGDTSLTLRWPLYSRSIVGFTQMTSGFFHRERSSVHCQDKWQAQESAPRLHCPSDKAQFRHAGPKFASGDHSRRAVCRRKSTFSIIWNRAVRVPVSDLYRNPSGSIRNDLSAERKQTPQVVEKAGNRWTDWKRAGLFTRRMSGVRVPARPPINICPDRTALRRRWGQPRS